MAGTSKQPKPRCPECGGTGLIENDKGTACCDCPAGRARTAAGNGLDYYD